MADAETQSSDGKLYTLSEISSRTGISMPTLQRYKKLYQGRIPSVGQGRKQRYPDSSLPVFDEIKNENIGRRGRPRKDPSAPRPAKAATPAKRRPGRPAKATPKRASGGGRRKAAVKSAPAPAAAAAPKRRGRPPGSGTKGRAQKSGGLLTLTQISDSTGISYPTLVRYVRLHSDRLPHEGKGRARRFYPQAVDAFRQLRSESGRGGRKKGKAASPARAASSRGPGRKSVASDLGNAVTKRLKAIEKTQQSLEKKFKGLLKNLQRLFR